MLETQQKPLGCIPSSIVITKTRLNISYIPLTNFIEIKYSIHLPQTPKEISLLLSKNSHIHSFRSYTDGNEMVNQGYWIKENGLQQSKSLRDKYFRIRMNEEKTEAIKIEIIVFMVSNSNAYEIELNGFMFDEIMGMEEFDVIKKDNDVIKLRKRVLVNKDMVILYQKSRIKDYYFFYKLIKVKGNGQGKINNRFIVYWDCSLSRTKYCNIFKERRVLENIIKKKKSITLILFSDSVQERINDINDIKTLGRVLDKVVYDGATILPEFNEKEGDIVLLFFDGIITYGDVDIEKLFVNNTIPYYVLTTSRKCNNDLLKYITKRTGGKIITNVSNINLIYKNKVSLIDCVYNENNVKDVFFEKYFDYYKIYGIVKNQNASLGLKFNDSKFDNNIVLNEMMDEKKIVTNELIRIVWAKRKLSFFKAFSYLPNMKKRMNDFRLQHLLSTKRTRFVILENVDDFLRHDIPPPESFKNVRKEYFEILSEKEKDSKVVVKERIERIVEKFERKKKWHQTDFGVRKKALSFSDGMKKKDDNEYDSKEEEESDNESDAYEDDFETKDVSFLLEDENEVILEEDDDLEIDDMEENYFIDDKKRKISFKIKSFTPGKRISFVKKVKKAIEQKLKPIQLLPSKRSRSHHYRPGSRISKTFVSLKIPQPKVQYLQQIRESEDHYEEYLNQKKSYFEHPTFYLDVADYFFKKGEKERGLRILSNVIEFGIDNTDLLRIIAYRLIKEKEFLLAKIIFENIIENEENKIPQSLNDLALVLEELGEYEKAIELLYNIIVGDWGEKYEEIDMTACIEMNHIFERIPNQKSSIIQKFNIDRRLIYKMDCDIKVSMKWDSGADIDLHIFDNYGEHCYYGKTSTNSGGEVSKDICYGYGPVEFFQKRVFESGIFNIIAKCYSLENLNNFIGTTILCTIFTNYMRKDESKKYVNIRILEDKEEVKICELKFIVE